MKSWVGHLLLALACCCAGDLPAQEAGTALTDADRDLVIIHLDQNWNPGWGNTGKNWYHHASQGAFMIAYDWFMALEQPTTAVPPPETPLFREPKNLARFGFLPSEPDPTYNPGNLPIGFAIAHDWVDPNRNNPPLRALGLTCAACHTGEVRYGKYRIRIEGGSAMINLSLFQQELAAAIFITNASSEKFDRFAGRIMPGNDSPELRGRLKRALEVAVAAGLKQKDLEHRMGVSGIESGFGRTDALARIGNSVFGKFGSVNLTDVDAPVNFPHVWDTPWFDWVQYNGSIRLPMVRNIGEALGLGAAAKITPDGDGNTSEYESTVDVENLHKMELLLSGDKPFAGLRAPAWPEELLGEIQGFRDRNGRWEQGRVLYQELCAHCHHLTEDYKSHQDSSDENDYWTKPNKFGRRFMKTPLVNIVDIGTDSTAALKFYRRIVYTGSLDETDVQIMPAVTALTIATVGVRDKAYSELKLTREQEQEYDGYREMPGEFGGGEPGATAPLEYKARSLDGVWATAPFLHNGSVPNLYELLVPAAERSTSFYVGSTEFDPVKVGFDTGWSPGAFRLQTTIPGNLNTGHEFRNPTPEEEDLQRIIGPWQKQRRGRDVDRKPALKGIVGRLLTDDERYAIIEYVKSLGSPVTQRKEIAHEYPPAQEDDAIRELGSVLAAIQSSTFEGQVQKANGAPVVAMRGQHLKNHAVVWARFRIENSPDLPAGARVGLFSEAKEYTALIRFSNGDSFNDAEPDVHGMAIKVLVPDATDSSRVESHDLVLADNRVFFAEDVARLLTFVKAKVQFARDGDRAAFGQVARNYPALEGFRKIPTKGLLAQDYWSQTPYRLGTQAVKYLVKATGAAAQAAEIADRSKRDFLREALIDQLTLKRVPATFDFCVQLQTDAESMPIENPTIPWNSPPVKVATIIIDPQRFDSAEQMQFCENLTYSPWRAPPEHQPLGGINRARNPIYGASSQVRHERNKAVPVEPTGRERF